MKKRDFEDNLLNKEKKALNEISDKDIIYDETQTGPQEEPFLFEFHVDIDAWKKFQEKNTNNTNKPKTNQHKDN